MDNFERRSRSPEQLEVALARAVVELRDKYPECSDIVIAHTLLSTGLPKGKEINNEQLRTIVDLASRIQESGYNLVDEIRREEEGMPSYLGVNPSGSQRHFGMLDAPTSDGVDRETQDAFERGDFPN